MTEICVNCNVAYITKKNGVVVEELADFGSYKLWNADLKKCPKCYHQIISGFSQQSFAEHYQKGYKNILKKIKKYGCYYYQWKEK